mmetsp:Transcript_489/g.1480  ORF Transcript_489/g.1480 Transcript_489/m.1480 type:complete len:251 (-) Transcript_489:1277-2029(-)
MHGFEADCHYCLQVITAYCQAVLIPGDARSQAPEQHLRHGFRPGGRRTFMPGWLRRLRAAGRRSPDISAHLWHHGHDERTPGSTWDPLLVARAAGTWLGCGSQLAWADGERPGHDGCREPASSPACLARTCHSSCRCRNSDKPQRHCQPWCQSSGARERAFHSWRGDVWTQRFILSAVSILASEAVVASPPHGPTAGGARAAAADCAPAEQRPEPEPGTVSHAGLQGRGRASGEAQEPLDLVGAALQQGL